jgi:hypothetical protein
MQVRCFSSHFHIVVTTVLTSEGLGLRDLTRMPQNNYIVSVTVQERREMRQRRVAVYGDEV